MHSASDMDPADLRLVERRQASKNFKPYSARSVEYVENRLQAFFEKESPGNAVSGVERIGGGASREQFVFCLKNPVEGETRFVLRMDPQLGITETDRRREFEILKAVQGIVPAPEPLWFDGEGQHFGCPAIIMKFVAGVTKPSDSGPTVTGLGTNLGDRLRPILKKEFIDHLVALHAMDWRGGALPAFSVPEADPRQAARWILNYWSALWEVDKIEDRPIITLAFEWLRRNLPDCDDLVVTHNDYRTGNYLFDEVSGKVTAILDWEYTRIGDYHDDLAYTLNDVFSTSQTGKTLASDLYEREEFISTYEARSGRSVNRKTLHFYEVLAPVKTYIIVAAHGMSAARRKQNHQDVLLTFVAATNALLAKSIVNVIARGSR